MAVRTSWRTSRMHRFEAHECEPMALVVPFEAEPAIERFDLAVTLGLAVAAAGGTLLVVGRHRPE